MPSQNNKLVIVKALSYSIMVRSAAQRKAMFANMNKSSPRSSLIWSARPIKSYSANPKVPYTQQYDRIGKTVTITTYPENNIIRVVKYGKNLTGYGSKYTSGSGKVHAKEFEDSFKGNRKALDYGLGKNRKVVDLQ